VWGALAGASRARVRALVLDDIVVDGATGEADMRFRGRGDRPGAVQGCGARPWRVELAAAYPDCCGRTVQLSLSRDAAQRVHCQ